MKSYILGYGSLIERASRTRTTPSAVTAYPVVAFGYMRGWFARTGDRGLSPTYLGCVPTDGETVNGVVYEVTPEELAATDAREKGYTRQQVAWNDINDLTGNVDEDLKVWIYCNDFNGDIPEENYPNKHFPIVESYVDICITGCIEAETEYPAAKQFGFIKNFVQSTYMWNSWWANDRLLPRRPFIHQNNAYTIDAYLEEYLINPDLFKQIYIE